ncbi:MAG: ABC transporter ATP-binding protein [Gammaproteobacteria bacterium]|nr:ABC transporter ATP-binding protein [Gammaproteobacteria bacterium]
MSTVIELNQVKFTWPRSDKPVLDIAELVIDKGQHLFIQGESGCGKTSLLNLLSGITEPDSGNLRILDQPLTALSPHQRDRFRADHLGVIFQQFNLLPYLNVIENVTLPFYFSDRRRHKVKDTHDAAINILRELEITSGLFEKDVLDLSVGQQQRVAVARALVGNPELVIADEPTSALDSKNRDTFLRLLFELSTEHDSTLIFVSHDDHLSSFFEHSINLAETNRAYQGEAV